ncbi:MAG: glycerol acyltransferase [Bacteroidales bacterium]|nr:glycerol acyltransferase [Bacteroidales bacterium]
MSTSGPIKIDVASVLASRLGKRARLIPRFLVRGVEKLICQDDLNALLEHNYPLRGAAFCRGVMKEMNIRLDVCNADRMPADPRVVVVSNHPLGGLDGIAMIAWLSERYPDKPVHFIVNDLLMAVEPLRDCFVPVNKHGAQNRDYARQLDEVLAGDGPVVIYPAGLVSRLHDDGRIADLNWRKMAVMKALESRRDIVPVHFDGQNSMSFYRWARRRVAAGIRFNYEMMLLPRELVRSRNKTFTLTVGHVVPWQSLAGRHPVVAAQELRSTVYSLVKRDSIS